MSQIKKISSFTQFLQTTNDFISTQPKPIIVPQNFFDDHLTKIPKNINTTNFFNSSTGTTLGETTSSIDMGDSGLVFSKKTGKKKQEKIELNNECDNYNKHDNKKEDMTSHTIQTLTFGPDGNQVRAKTSGTNDNTVYHPSLPLYSSTTAKNISNKSSDSKSVPDTKTIHETKISLPVAATVTPVLQKETVISTTKKQSPQEEIIVSATPPVLQKEIFVSPPKKQSPQGSASASVIEIPTVKSEPIAIIPTDASITEQTIETPKHIATYESVVHDLGVLGRLEQSYKLRLIEGRIAIDDRYLQAVQRALTGDDRSSTMEYIKQLIVDSESFKNELVGDIIKTSTGVTVAELSTSTIYRDLKFKLKELIEKLKAADSGLKNLKITYQYDINIGISFDEFTKLINKICDDANKELPLN